MGQDKKELRCTEHIRLAESFMDIFLWTIMLLIYHPPHKETPHHLSVER